MLRVSYIELMVLLKLIVKCIGQVDDSHNPAAFGGVSHVQTELWNNAIDPPDGNLATTPFCCHMMIV